MKAPTHNVESSNNAPVGTETVKATQLYKAPESKNEIMERHHTVKREDGENAEQRCSEMIQYNDAYGTWKPSFLNMMKKCESM